MQDKPYDSTQDELKATILEVVTTMKDLMRLNPLYKEHIQMFVQVHLLIYVDFSNIIEIY
jgi:Lon-like ATP-dependent protease